MRMKIAICACVLSAMMGLGTVPCAAQDTAAPEQQPATEAEDAPKPLSLKADPAQDKEAGKQLRKLIKEHAEQGDYNGLKDELERLLKEDFPKAFENAKRPLWKAPVKGALAKHALAVQVCINLAQRSTETADSDAQKKEPEFMKWLVADGKAPARAFVEGLNKGKITEEEDAVGMMGSLRSSYAEMGKKAFSEIKGITNPAGGAVSRKFYPMDRKELDKRMQKVLGTRPAHGANKEQQDAVNMANLYRLLCGLPTNMIYDAGYAKDAQQAAEACAKAGTISHGLGANTDKCNLHMGSMPITPAESVKEYVEDPGDNNYEKRGHRAWILFPKSGKTGFGVKGGFHAMRTSDLSGPSVPTARSYPGRGFFPKEYLLGDGWSYYPAEGQSVGGSATVKIWRLSRSPKSAPTAKELADAKEIKIKKVCVHPNNGMFPVGNSIVFMPDYSQMAGKDGKPVGIYWVTIDSGSLHDEYVVDIF